MYHNLSRQQGAATLILTVILMVAATLVMIFMANYSTMQQKGVTNTYASEQAFEAAEAGLEYGIAFIQRNRATVIAGPVSGFINYGSANSSLTNVTLANNSKYSVVFTNPTANNFNSILVTSTGTSSDATSTRLVRQLVQYKPLLVTVPNSPTNVLGAASLAGSATIRNLIGTFSIIAGSTIGYQGSASSTSIAGSSNRQNPSGPDIQPNSSSLNSLTADQFFNLYFGASSNVVKGSFVNFYPSGSTPSLDGLTATSVWIDGPYTLTGNDNIGTATDPVLIVVNGAFAMQGNSTIYGFVFALGDISSQGGTPNIIGGFATSGNLDLQGNPDILYSDAVLNIVSQNLGISPKVPGSWRDY